MVTGALVTLVQRRAPNWSVQNIVDVLNDINRIMMSKELLPQIVYDTTTGDLPKLTTVAGTYEYEIKTPAFTYNGWKVAEVTTSMDGEPLDVTTREMVRTSATSVTYAKVIFHDDPGTADYYVKFYKAPTSILTTANQLDVPERFHLSHVYTATVGWIELATSGKSAAWDNFLQTLLPEFWAEMNKDSINSDHFVTPVGY